jgi:hypothetical protein
VKHLIAAIIFLLPVSSEACNVCGGSSGNQYLGVLPQFYKHFVGLQYQHRDFTSEHPGHAKDGKSSFSNEYYNTYQLWGRYNAGKRLRLFAFVPYISNIKTENGNRTLHNGIGDITVLANIRLLGLKQQKSEWQHDLQAGGGVKLPTGTYNQTAIGSGNELPNMQPGTKSWDFVANANYTLRRRALGANVDVSYTIINPNINNYKFGNRFSSGLSGFYWWQMQNITVLPQVGVRLDAAAGDYEDYSKKIRNDMNGGEQLYATVGMQAYYKRSGLQFMFYKPLSQQYADGLVKNNFRAEAGIYFML